MERSGRTPRWSEQESDPLVSTRISSEPAVEMGDYLSVIRRRKLLIAAMTLAGLALALFYSVAVAKPSYVSDAKVLVKPITSDVTPASPDKLIIGMWPVCRSHRSVSVGNGSSQV